MQRLLRAGLMPVWLLLIPVAGAAQAMPDPTRPPAVLSLPPGSIAEPQSSGPQLQSVRISAHHASALISGHRVMIGDRFGDAKVVAITENDVVLDGAAGRQTLKLFPGVGKRMIVRSHSAGPRHSRLVR